MAEIKPRLDAILANLDKADYIPQVMKDTIRSTVSSLQSYDTSKALQVGDKLPEFSLPDHTGKHLTSAELLAKGPIVITFYRGEWCPYCNIALSGFQEHLDEFEKAGVTLVAITPEKPDYTGSISEKQGLRFPVLSDVHNDYARRLGVVWKNPDGFHAFLTDKHQVPTRNGDDSFEMPYPATYLVDKTGVVRNAYLVADYSKRVEPKTVLGWIHAL